MIPGIMVGPLLTDSLIDVNAGHKPGVEIQVRRLFAKRVAGARELFMVLSSPESYPLQSRYPPDVIERQLAHVPGNQVRAAYNRAEYLPERRKMMQDWADYLDQLKSNSINPT